MDTDMTILRTKTSQLVELTLFEKYVVEVLLDEIDLINLKMQTKVIKLA